MCPKLNVLVLRQNALLTACMVLKWIMSIMSYSAEFCSAHTCTYIHTHCFPVKRHWFLHQVTVWPRCESWITMTWLGTQRISVWMLSSHCWQPINSRKPNGHTSSASASFAVPQTFLLVCLMQCRPHVRSASQWGWSYVLDACPFLGTCICYLW